MKLSDNNKNGSGTLKMSKKMKKSTHQKPRIWASEDKQYIAYGITEPRCFSLFGRKRTVNKKAEK